MDALKAALVRLENALDRLDSAVVAREGRHAAREAELARDLEAARVAKDRTAQVAETVSDRLDDAIGRLEAVLES